MYRTLNAHCIIIKPSSDASGGGEGAVELPVHFGIKNPYSGYM